MPFAARASLLAALLLAACGGSSNKDAPAPAISTLVPADNAVSGWIRSGALRVLPAATAGLGASQGGVNGDADPFIRRGLVQLAIQRYTRSAELLELRIWQMRDAAADRGLLGLRHLRDPLPGLRPGRHPSHLGGRDAEREEPAPPEERTRVAAAGRPRVAPPGGA